MKSVRRHARAFTLVEALLATSITAMVGAAVLLGIAGAIEATDAGLRQSLAVGMAQQLMDEISCQLYMEAGDNPRNPILQSEAGESAGPGRSQYDDLDDYNGLSIQPPQDRWGISLGADDGQGGQRHPNFKARPNFWNGYRQVVDVKYVSEGNLSTPLMAGLASDYRSVTVQVLVDDAVRGPQPAAQLKRIFTYAPAQ